MNKTGKRITKTKPTVEGTVVGLTSQYKAYAEIAKLWYEYQHTPMIDAKA